MLATLRTTPSYFLRPIELFRSYRRADLQPDLIAGLTVGVVLLPQSIVFSLVAGLPPAMGLYSAIIATIVGALWGSSRHLNTGPTNSASILVLSTLLPIAARETPAYIAAAGLLAVMAGVVRLLMGVARLGVLVNFVSDSVIVGFTAGAGALIIAGQLSTLMRVPAPGAPDLFGTILGVVPQIPAAHALSLTLGIATALFIIALRRLAPRIPATLAGIVVSGLVVWGFGLDRLGVQVLGELPRSLPPLAQLPLFNLDLVGQLANGALAMAAIGLVEAVSIARSISGSSGQRLDSNQEFIGQGLANIVTGIFSGYPTSGSFNRSALLYRAAGQTSMANVFSGLFVLGAMFVLAPLAAYVPRAVLAAELIITAYGMINQREIARIWRGARGDAVIMIVTLLTTLFLPLQFAVLAGVLMSLGYYILQTSTPHVHSVLPDDDFRHWQHQPQKPSCPQLGVVDVLGDLYFGAVSHVEEEIRNNLKRNPNQRYLLLRMHSVHRCDISGINALESIVRSYRAQGGDVFMVRVREPVLRLMESTNFCAFFGRDHFLSEDQAIGFLFHKVIDPAICIYECDVRAFRECQNLPKRHLPLMIPLQTTLPANGIANIAPAELWNRLRRPEPPLVLDVREPREYQQGHIPKSQLMPLAALLANGKELPRDRPLVLVCRSGRRSGRAAWALLNSGYTNIAVLEGGLQAWETANLLLATGERG